MTQADSIVTGLTDVAGLTVGHDTDLDGITGCTVVLCPTGAVAGVDVRGCAPGTRETDPLRPINLIERVHAILLSGGSAYGLDAAGGVMRYLEERGIGFNTGYALVPLVPAAVLYDLAIGRADHRPDATAGYRACLAATTANPEGSIGAGTGATIGKLHGPGRAVKAGVGTASIRLGNGCVIGALVVVNAFGDIYDPDTGVLLAGPRHPHGGFINTMDTLKQVGAFPMFGGAINTTLAVVATNATLTKEHANLMARMAHNGLARAIRPVHTMFDGDTVFALATCQPDAPPADPSIVGAVAADVLAQAIVRAIHHATSLGGIPCVADLV